MLEQYAMVPYPAQVERFPFSKPWEPAPGGCAPLSRALALLAFLIPAPLSCKGEIFSCLLSHHSDAHQRLKPLKRSWLPLFCMLLAFFCSGRRSFSLKRSSRNCREEEVIINNLFLSAVPG
jgi:hypothetical protein